VSSSPVVRRPVPPTAAGSAPARSRWPYGELLAGAVLATLVFWQLTAHPDGFVADVFTDRRKDLYNAVLSLSSGLLGFVLATLAIVVGYAQSERFALLRASRWHLSLYTTFLQCVRALLATVVCSLVSLFVDREQAEVPVLAAVTLAAVLVGLLRLARTMYVFQRVVAIVTSSGAREPGE
jgi:hypothetical protein